MNLNKQIEELQKEIARLEQWIDDLQSGLYINCVYCGYNFGREDSVDESMRTSLQKHMETCPKHPMSILKLRNEKLEGFKTEIDELMELMVDQYNSGIQYMPNYNFFFQEVCKSVDKIKEK